MNLVRSGQIRGLEVAKIDGEPSLGTPLAEELIAHGFSPGYKGPTYRP